MGHNQLGEFSRYYNQQSSTHPSSAQPASVVLLIHEAEGIPQINFIVRASHPNDVYHGGQVAFPGGKQELDETLESCAMRELEEEIGIQLTDQNPLYPLSPLYIAISNFIVQPYVAFYEEDPTFIMDSTEIDEIITVPLINLADNFQVNRKDWTVRNRHLKSIPYYDLNGHTLWGATAIIFTEFLTILRKGFD